MIEFNGRKIPDLMDEEVHHPTFQEALAVKNKHLPEFRMIGSLQGIRMATDTTGTPLIELYIKCVDADAIPQNLDGIKISPVLVDKVLL